MKRQATDWERLQFDFVQEEIRRNTKDGATSKTDEEDKKKLVGKGKIQLEPWQEERSQ